MLDNPTPIDWRAPDYAAIFRERSKRLARIRSGDVDIEKLRLYYADHIPQFINDWGVTVDPRVIGKDKPRIMPFVLFPRQIEWLEFILERWATQTPGITEKSRDVGISWLAMALSVSLGLFNRNVQVGFGSAKEDKVDRSGDPDTLFYKGRMFLQYLPAEFRPGWDLRRHSSHMRIILPATESSITGEAGDNIGRGGRASLYFIDESAHLERPQLIDASLTATTDCRQDMSSVNGTANSFAERRHSGATPVFTFHYSDDPRKTTEWAVAKQAVTDPVVWAQEYEINYSASVEGIVIPAIWVTAAIDAHKKLGITPSGVKLAGYDVADRGIDKCAVALRHGILLTHAEEWSGATGDLFKSAEKAFLVCDMHGVPAMLYDGDGLGANVRGDARVINEKRTASKVKPLKVTQFRGSAGVLDPERMVRGTDRKNEDFFENYKAQAWWDLRYRFQDTYNAVVNGHKFDPSNIISIDGAMPNRAAVCRELSQPVYKLSKSGKVMIDKAPDGVKSPNYGDAVMMAFAPKRPALEISDDLLIASGP
jgi:phage terminase large subunit